MPGFRFIALQFNSQQLYVQCFNVADIVVLCNTTFIIECAIERQCWGQLLVHKPHTEEVVLDNAQLTYKRHSRVRGLPLWWHQGSLCVLDLREKCSGAPCHPTHLRNIT